MKEEQMGKAKRLVVFAIGVVFGLSLITMGFSQPAAAADPIKIRCGWTMPTAHPMGIGSKM